MTNEADMNLTILRESTIIVADGENYTPGKLYYNGVQFCFTVEDEDRHLEDGQEEKVYGRTAIPRGRYRLLATFSHRFQRVLPILLGVPGFEGVRIHGGNTAEDSSGCILVGKVRTSTGIAQRSDTVERIIDMIDGANDTGAEVWLEIK
jgi:hypothetical protein